MRSKFRWHSKMDAIERAQNSRYSRARKLYRHILEDLDPQHFTKEEIVNSFNPLTKSKPGGENGDTGSDYPIVNVDFGKSDLALLVKIGLIEFNEDEQTYHITQENIKFAYPKEYWEEEDDEVEQDIRDSYEFIGDNQCT